MQEMKKQLGKRMCSVFTGNLMRCNLVMGFWELPIMRGQSEKEVSLKMLKKECSEKN